MDLHFRPFQKWSDLIQFLSGLTRFLSGLVQFSIQSVGLRGIRHPVLLEKKLDHGTVKLYHIGPWYGSAASGIRFDCVTLDQKNGSNTSGIRFCWIVLDRENGSVTSGIRFDWTKKLDLVQSRCTTLVQEHGPVIRYPV